MQGQQKVPDAGRGQEALHQAPPASAQRARNECVTSLLQAVSAVLAAAAKADQPDLPGLAACLAALAQLLPQAAAAAQHQQSRQPSREDADAPLPASSEAAGAALGPGSQLWVEPEGLSSEQMATCLNELLQVLCAEVMLSDPTSAALTAA